MAITFNKLVDTLPAGASPSTSGVVTPGAGNLLLAFGVNNKAGATDGTMGGTLTGTWTKVAQNTASAATTGTVFKCTDYGASGTITYTVASNSTQLAVLEVIGSDLTIVQSKTDRQTFSTTTGLSVTLDNPLGATGKMVTFSVNFQGLASSVTDTNLNYTPDGTWNSYIQHGTDNSAGLTWAIRNELGVVIGVEVKTAISGKTAGFGPLKTGWRR